MALRWVVWLSGVAYATAADAEEATCPAGGTCGQLPMPDYWPTPRGHTGSLGVSPYNAPFNLTSSFAWKWYAPEGRYSSIFFGAVIDGKKNIYVSSYHAVHKLSPAGVLLWTYSPAPDRIPDAPVLYKGTLLFDTNSGSLYALDAETGKLKYNKKVSSQICADTAFITVHRDIAVLGTESENWLKCSKMKGVNVSTGEVLWEFAPDEAVWNVMAMFPDDDSFVFQDLAGKAYRNDLTTGKNLWKAGGWPNSWTDGTQMLGPNGLVYAVTVNGCSGPDCPGSLAAYRLSDGKEVWKKLVPRPPNSFPAVGKIGKTDELSVVMPIGQQPGCDPGTFKIFQAFTFLQALPMSIQAPIFNFFHFLGIALGDYAQKIWQNPSLPTDLLAFNAETGKLRWKWVGPTHRRYMCAGDDEGFITRAQSGERGACCPNTWSAPTIGPDGTIYVGNQDGKFYAVRDANGDNVIDDVTEVSAYDTGAAFSSPGAAFAPGMVVMTACDGVYVFKQ